MTSYGPRSVKLVVVCVSACTWHIVGTVQIVCLDFCLQMENLIVFAFVSVKSITQFVHTFPVYFWFIFCFADWLFLICVYVCSMASLFVLHLCVLCMYILIAMKCYQRKKRLFLRKCLRLRNEFIHGVVAMQWEMRLQ